MSGLRIEYLRARVGDFEITVPRLDVEPGKVCCLIGKSGSGKSTFLNAVAGFVDLLQGTVTFQGRDLTSLPPEKRRMAMIFQRGALFPHLTVLANVEYGLVVQKVPGGERRARAIRWLERLQIPELHNRYPNEISVGQAQRVGIARGLAVGFPVLLLDEPFSALDPATARALRALLREIVTESKVCALLVTHNAHDLREIGDYAVSLSGGKVMWAGDPKVMDFSDGLLLTE